MWWFIDWVLCLQKKIKYRNNSEHTWFNDIKIIGVRDNSHAILLDNLILILLGVKSDLEEFFLLLN